MALPKFKEVKAIIEKQVSTRFREVSRQEMRPFNESPSFIQHEGRTLIHNTLDNQGSSKTMNYQKTQVKYKFEYSKIPDMTPEDVIAIVDEKAKQLGSEMAKYHFSVISKTVKETGNTVNANNKPLTPEIFLEAISKIAVSFDEDGNPRLPTIVIGHKSAEQWKKLIAAAEADPEHKKKLDALIARKRKEFDAEQARRKLVD